MPSKIKLPEYARDGIPRSEQNFVGRNKITILDKAQQEGMRKVCRLTREVLDVAAAALKPGVTTDYIDELVHKACIERDVSDCPFDETGLTSDVPLLDSRIRPLSTTTIFQNRSAHLSMK